ncbi:MAG: polyphosphate kinase 2 family protein [Candidatus Korobacteraceae bacterium]|jgi:PPK2 family polyphosphate:nucleotide phosphotransferase
MNAEKTIERILKRYRVEDGKGFDLADHQPDDTNGFDADFKPEAQRLLQQQAQQLSDLQDMLYAQDRWALLLIFQAMDAAGKDGTIKHVMSGVNPQGCQVFSFKAPSSEELDHDFLWRTTRCLPQRGRIGIFNRSYYEEVLVVRVHKELLRYQRIPEELITKKIWEHRFEDIAAFERYLSRNGIVVRKFFLHISQEEQRARFLKRLEDSVKNWKFSAADIRERRCWDDYQRAYEDMIRHTAAEHAPWFVVPANKKWYARLVVSMVVVDALKQLKLAYPKVSPEARQELEKAKADLLHPGKRKDDHCEKRVPRPA